MIEAKYFTNDELYDTLGEFSRRLLEAMGDNTVPAEVRAKQLAMQVEMLTQEIWDGTPRIGEIYPSNN